MGVLGGRDRQGTRRGRKGLEAESPPSVELCSICAEAKKKKKPVREILRIDPCVFGLQLLVLEGQACADGDFAPDADAVVTRTVMPAN